MQNNRPDKEIAYVGLFLNNERSVARVRQLKQLEALKAFGKVTIYAGIASKADQQVGKIGSGSKIISWLKKNLTSANNLRIKWGAFRSSRFPDGGEFYAIKETIGSSKKFDVVVASYGPWSALLLGFLLWKKNPGAKFILDYRDIYTKNPYFTGLPILRNVERAFDKHIQKKSDLVTTVSLGMASELLGNVAVVYTGPYKNISKGTCNNAICISQLIATERITLGFFGTYYNQFSFAPVINNLQSLRTADKKIDWVIAGDCSILNDILQKFLGEKQIYGKLKNLGFISPQEVVTVRQELTAEILFTVTESGPGVLTSKVYEYIDTGVTILVSGIALEQELCLLLNGAKQVAYCEGAYCVPHTLGGIPKSETYDSFSEPYGKTIL